MVSFGNVLRDLRKQKKMTQKELSNGICTQALISLIEKGDIIPSVDICYKLGRKLNVSLDFLIEKMNYPNYEYIRELNLQIKTFLRERNYYEISAIVAIEKASPNYKDPIFKQLIHWQEGICKYYLEKNYEASLKILQDALSLRQNKHSYSEREIEIINSIGIIHSEEKNNIEALNYFDKAIENLKKIDYISDLQIEIKLLYSKAKALTQLNRYGDSIDFCNTAIKACNKLETTFLLGELLYQLGFNLESLHLFKQANEEYNKAIQIFTIQKNELFRKHTENQIKNFPAEALLI